MKRINPNVCATKPFAHQIVGINLLLNHPNFAIFDEMGSGKSKQVIDAACELFLNGEISEVIVVAPAACKSVWYDADENQGQIKKHAWVGSRVIEICGSANRKTGICKEHWSNRITHGVGTLHWTVVSYEWLRNAKNLKWILNRMFTNGGSFYVIFDESSYIKNRTSAQSKSCMKLSYSPYVTRRTILNGTPITQTPMDLWSQLTIMSPHVLQRFKNFYHFRNTYAILGGWHAKQIVSYRDLDKLSSLVAPYVIRRLKSDCLDLPPITDTHRDVTLDDQTWKLYQQLKKEALVELNDGDKRLEPNAAVRLIRLSQLTSGFIGGKVHVNLDDPQLPLIENLPPEINSSEKLDWCEKFLDDCDANAIIVWCRFRKERERLVERMTNQNGWAVFELYGGQVRTARDDAKTVFSRKITGDRKYLLVAQPQAGGLGLTLTAANTIVYLSKDYSSFWYKQSRDRVHRPGQDSPVTCVDCLAVGPRGQHTIDHVISKALANNDNIAAWTARAWREKLEVE